MWERDKERSNNFDIRIFYYGRHSITGYYVEIGIILYEGLEFLYVGVRGRYLCNYFDNNSSVSFIDELNN